MVQRQLYANVARGLIACNHDGCVARFRSVQNADGLLGHEPLAGIGIDLSADLVEIENLIVAPAVERHDFVLKRALGPGNGGHQRRQDNTRHSPLMVSHRGERRWQGCSRSAASLRRLSRSANWSRLSHPAECVQMFSADGPTGRARIDGTAIPSHSVEARTSPRPGANELTTGKLHAKCPRSGTMPPGAGSKSLSAIPTAQQPAARAGLKAIPYPPGSVELGEGRIARVFHPSPDVYSGRSEFPDRC